MENEKYGRTYEETYDKYKTDFQEANRRIHTPSLRESGKRMMLRTARKALKDLENIAEEPRNKYHINFEDLQ